MLLTNIVGFLFLQTIHAQRKQQRTNLFIKKNSKIINRQECFSVFDILNRCIYLLVDACS